MAIRYLVIVCELLFDESSHNFGLLGSEVIYLIRHDLREVLTLQVHLGKFGSQLQFRMLYSSALKLKSEVPNLLEVFKHPGHLGSQHSDLGYSFGCSSHQFLIFEIDVT